VSYSVLLGLILGSLTDEARVNLRKCFSVSVFNKTVIIAIRFLSLINYTIDIHKIHNETQNTLIYKKFTQ
jgi:hypothetical protein